MMNGSVSAGRYNLGRFEKEEEREERKKDPWILKGDVLEKQKHLRRAYSIELRKQQLWGQVWMESQTVVYFMVLRNGPRPNPMSQFQLLLSVTKSMVRACLVVGTAFMPALPSGFCLCQLRI